MPSRNSGKKKFPSIERTLDEIIHLYDIEESRRQALESKAGIFLGSLGVVATLTPILSRDSSIFFFISLYLSLAISFVAGINTIKISKYNVPHKKIEDFYQYAEMKSKDLNDQFLLNYIEALKELMKLNDKKAQNIKTSSIFLTISVMIIVANSLFQFY